MDTAAKQRAEIERLLSKFDKKIADAFLEGINKISDSVTLKRIADDLKSRNYSGILSSFNNAIIQEGLITFSRTLTEAMIAGGDYGSRLASSSRVEFGFSVTESNTARFMENYLAERIKQISNEMKTNITQTIYREISAGTGPIETARRIKQGLGLTESQSKQVGNYRRYLEGGERRALELRLRDARYDPTIARSIKEGKALSPKQIDKMVAAYERRFVSRRAQTIARTESMTMVNSGNQQYWNQAVRAGVVRENEIVRYWKNSHDSKVRSSHISIPTLNPDGVGLNDSFRSPLGLIRYPGDPAASGGNRINCRCYLFIKIVRV